ncbi:MAG: phosphomannomutase/phosphoglucomutase [Chloroflexota bacterium]|nr:phosphomannomutase/phosphoglucomutase [Chloroflexota bacterium]
MSEAGGGSKTQADIGALFKAYDIRGVVPEELTPEIAHQVGRGLVAYLQADTVAVGRDMRVSGPALSAALIEGIRDQGADVIDLGLVSSDALYFAVGKFGYPAGAMITASHNPAEYNGIKICREEARPLSLEEGIGQIRDLVLSGAYPPPLGGRRGSVSQRDVLDAYAEHVLSLIDPGKVRPLKIAIDAGNGMAGETVPRVFKHLPCEVVPLYFELDGTFPNHPANPLEPENVKDLQRVVIEQQCDLGAAFDGDADRVFLIDERGQFVGGDMTTAMVSVAMLARNPSAPIVYNLICSRSVPETIERLGGRPIRTRVGHSYIKATMRQEDAVFGGEHSGHFYFRDNWYADSGLIALLTVLQLVSEAGESLSAVLRPLDTRVRSGEINNEVADPPAVMATVEATYRAKGAGIDKLDGLTVEFPDWWFNLRSSNTQPLLRLNVEADDPEQLRLGTQEVLSLVAPAP